MRSLRNRLALVFFGITLLAIGALYLYVAPGLQTRLVDEKLSALAGAAGRYSGPIRTTVGAAFDPPEVQSRVDFAALDSGDRVILYSVASAFSPSGPQLTLQADSSNRLAAPSLAVPVAYTAASTGRMATGVESAPGGLVAEAADPLTRLVPTTGEVDTTAHQYWLRPGAFCEVSVPIGEARPAIVVPAISVQPTATGNIVYTVDDKNVAHLKQVALGMYTPEGGVEITQGLVDGDLLVIEGFEALSEGAPVNIKSRTTVEASEAAGAAEAAPSASSSASPRGSARASGSAKPPAPGASP